MPAFLNSVCVCKNLRNFLVVKSTCVTSGWVLNVAITTSVVTAVSTTGQLAAQAKTEADEDHHIAVGGAGVDLDLTARQAFYAFLATFFIFSLVLIASALLSRVLIGIEWIPQKFRNTYAGGLSFIPAWQWQNVVSFLMVVFLGSSAASRPPHIVAFVVLAIAVISAWVEILLEQQVAVVDETSFTFQVFNSLKTSLGLGMGFAVNVAVYAVLGSRMKRASIIAVYVSCLTVAVALLQYFLKPLLARKKYAWPEFLVRTLSFLLLACNFVVGWAWKSSIDMAIAPFMEKGVAWQLFASVLITCFLTCLVIGITVAAHNDDDNPPTSERSPTSASPMMMRRRSSVFSAALVFSRLPGLEDLVILASAMNVGWTWSAFGMACLHWFEANYWDGEPVDLLEFWIFAMLVVTCASITAILLDVVINQLEPVVPEEQPLVKSP